MAAQARARALSLLKAAATVALLTIAVLTLRNQLPSPSDVVTALGDAGPGWLVLAATAEFVSIAMFGVQQRRLLTAFGIGMTRHRALALAYSRSAIAISMPAGSALSAVHAFRQYRICGAARNTAATVVALSALVSVAALLLLYGTGALGAAAVELTAAWPAHPALTQVTVTLALLTFVGLMTWLSIRPARAGRSRRGVPGFLRWVPRPVLDAIDSSRAVPARHWRFALGAALTNWLTDLLCLYAAVRAFHLPIGPVALGAIYLTVQLVRQLPLTPGGIGVIEISLLTGLVSAGADAAPATAAVLVYRLLSCWLVIPAGLASWLGLRRPPGAQRPARPAGTASPAARSGSCCP